MQQMSPSNNGSAHHPQGVRNGNACACASCGKRIAPKRTGRKRKFCCDSCRDDNRRQLNFAFSGATRYPCQAKPRNASNPSTNSTACKPENGGRGSAINGLWQRVIQVEIVDAHTWREEVSADGVVSQVAQLQPRALRG
jgi:hypothetical protein